MKTTNLKQLKCILCESDLKVTDEIEVSVSEVNWANLECISCKNKYPVVYGIPILMPSEAHVSVKKHKIEDNLVKKGPMVSEIIAKIASGQLEQIKFSLLAPRLRRTTYDKKMSRSEAENNRLSRKLPGFIAKRINWKYYYFTKWLMAKLTFEEFRRRRQENKIFEYLEREDTALGFLKNYFKQNNEMDEYFYYYAYRYSQPRYLAGISLTSIFPESQQPILDLACGVGHYMHYLTTTRPEQLCIGLDRDFVSLYIAKKFIAPKGEYICAEADLSLPFSTGYFSGVLCSDAFQYFGNRSTAAQEMQRVLSNKGVLILTRIANSLVYSMEGPEQITPSELENLFEKLPNVIVGEDMMRKRYIQKLGPDLSIKKRKKELDKMMHLSIVASNRNDLFIDYGMFDSWPHSVGNLKLNPLYHESNKDKSGNTIYTFKYPSEWYEFENKGWLEHASDNITLTSDVKKALTNGTRSTEIDKLVDNFIVFGMPKNYL